MYGALHLDSHIQNVINGREESLRNLEGFKLDGGFNLSFGTNGLIEMPAFKTAFGFSDSRP